ncbi:hypothetical protein PAXINDRAFT_152541 [Paxillus involutus ATCC 200175]|nr:hypothetical protein PAXINDRAFT_152541 [Paxillus involutus ATCC 200175]
MQAMEKTSNDRHNILSEAITNFSSSLGEIKQSTAGIAEALRSQRSQGQATRCNNVTDEGSEPDDEGSHKKKRKTPRYKSSYDWDILLVIHLLLLLKIKSLDSLNELPPPLTEDEITAFEAGHAFTSGLFYPKAPSEDFVNAERVREALDTHMQHVKRRYRQIGQPRNLTVKRQRKIAQSSRKDTLLDSCLHACWSRISIQHHSRLLKKLGHQAMSGNETDPENCGPFLIVRPAWQSVAFAKFLHNLDTIYCTNWRNPHGQEAIRGNPPHFCVASDCSEEGHAPAHLPRNCYDADWLGKLCPWVKDKLGVTEEEYVFYINPTELEE